MSIVDWLQQQNQSSLSLSYNIDLGAPLRFSKIKLRWLNILEPKEFVTKNSSPILEMSQHKSQDQCQLIHKTFFLTIYHNILTRLQTQLSPRVSLLNSSSLLNWFAVYFKMLNIATSMSDSQHKLYLINSAFLFHNWQEA